MGDVTLWSETRVRFADCDPMGVAHHSFVTHACDDNRLLFIAEYPLIPPLRVVRLDAHYARPLYPGSVVRVEGVYSLDEEHPGTACGEYTLFRDDVVAVKALYAFRVPPLMRAEVEAVLG